jgi:hypothetical protein
MVTLWIAPLLQNNSVFTNYDVLQEKYNNLELKFNEVLNHSKIKEKELGEINIKNKIESTRINMIEIEKYVLNFYIIFYLFIY